MGRRRQSTGGFRPSYTRDCDERLIRRTMAGPFPGYADYPELNAVIGWLADRHDVYTLWIATESITRHPAQWEVLSTSAQARAAPRVSPG